MPVDSLISVEEYLATSYDPDRELVDGVLLERNVGEFGHAKLQGDIYFALRTFGSAHGYTAAVEARLKVGEARYRIPDVCFLYGAGPRNGPLLEAPFLCVEVLSPDDRLTDMQARIDDYLGMGVRFVWIADPITRKAWVHTSSGVTYSREGEVFTTDPDIQLKLADIMT